MACLDERAVARRLAGELDAELLAAQEEHIAACSSCRRWLAVLARAADPLGGNGQGSAPGPRKREVGAVIGRHVVLEVLGRGGMGEVFAAYDPELDRRIALKLVRPERGEAPDAAGRLIREARAMARLSTPHVATVHDVGVCDDEVFIAMEYIAGTTLREWLSRRKREWRSIVEVFVSAGRGLAVAHAAGILHRDFKPDNVMVVERDDQIERVAVVDFGLAYALAGASGRSLPADPSADVLEETLTRSGACVGTPAYLSPEQYRGRALEATSDQFSFCVALYEALFGRRPFAGETLEAIQLAVEDAAVQPRPRDSSVPQRIRSVVLRGLAHDPKARWPSMEALLEALQPSHTRGRRRELLAPLGMIGLIVGAVAGWQALDQRRRIAACEEAGASIEQAWNDDRREALRQAMRATGVIHANATADKLMPWIDEHARAWQATRTEACLHAEVHGTWSREALERSSWCLDERRMELEALLDELGRGEPGGIERAIPAAAALGQLEPCRDVDRLLRLPSPPRSHLEAAQAARAMLSKARALEQTGAYEEGIGIVHEALSIAGHIDWPPLVAAAQLRLGELLLRAGDYAKAEHVLDDAYFEAARAGASEIAAEAASLLAYTVGCQLARHEDGLRWARQAEVLLASSSDPTQMRLASHLAKLAPLHAAMGAYEEAMTLHGRALEIQEQALGTDHPAVAETIGSLASLHARIGDYEEAKALHQRALVVTERVFGRDHPMVARDLNNLANVHQLMGRYEEARTLYRRALDIWEGAFGPEHPNLARSSSNFARLQWVLGAHDEAKQLYARALAIDEKALGPEHPELAEHLIGLGVVHREVGEHTEARTLLARALAIQEKALGPDHTDVGRSLNNLADVHYEMGSLDEAEALFGRALAIREQALGTDHPHLAYSVFGLARVALAQHRAEAAVPLAERATRLRENAGSATLEVADARFLLARALWEARTDRARAVELARAAHEAYRQHGRPHDQELEIRQWLDAHAAEP